MKNNYIPLVDEYLQCLNGIQQAEQRPFFLTRLKARMQKEDSNYWFLSLKPAWLIGLLALFLCINGLVVIKEVQSNKAEKSSSALKSFANTYNLNVSNY